MKLNKNEVHIWSTSLSMKADELDVAKSLLSPEEAARAARFHLALHRDRFIASHSWLRNILSLYLDIASSTISYSYTEHKKPYLSPIHHKQLYFNLTHSADMAACAISIDQELGVDIEKMGSESKEDLAKRFFSQTEHSLISEGSHESRITRFYQIWVRKEAILKATGKGLSTPLNQFSVSVEPGLTHIELENKVWSLLPLSIHPDYQAALAVGGKINRICYFDFINHKPHLVNEQVLS